ncbi:hypothetical protein [Rickettsia felis]|uniref:hypothetical protein n=1 Tax=Rickettsia felis TaxID=42862 RepID=UPI001F43AA01|nr:hypothetical protein [Rickettsia felis]
MTLQTPLAHILTITKEWKLINSSDNSIQDNINVISYSIVSAAANKTDYINTSSKRDR